MHIIIKTTNIELMPAIRSYLEDKISSLSNFIKPLKPKGVVQTDIEIAKTTKHHRKGDIFRAEVNIHLPGKLLRAESEQWDIRVAIDEVKDELQRQLKKYVEKAVAKNKRGARKMKRRYLRLPALEEKGGRVREEGI